MIMINVTVGKIKINSISALFVCDIFPRSNDYKETK